MYDILLILHFFGLALGVGAGLATLSLGLATKDLDPAERGKFMMRVAVLRKNSSFGLLLLIASGLGFLLERGWSATAFRGGGFFHAKLTLVVVMAGLFGYSQVLAKKAREQRGGPVMGKLVLLGRVMVGIGLTIIVLAVLAFH
ncbi:MAG TPA: hypothetical protein VMS65_17780 [Polyangiaceae bacterium]|nr:hypothetical protein [Polyangiaceae bacterium]